METKGSCDCYFNFIKQRQFTDTPAIAQMQLHHPYDPYTNQWALCCGVMDDRNKEMVVYFLNPLPHDASHCTAFCP